MFKMTVATETKRYQYTEQDSKVQSCTDSCHWGEHIVMTV